MNETEAILDSSPGPVWLNGLLENLAAQQARGQRLVYLAPPVRQAFFAEAPAATAVPVRPAPAARPATTFYDRPAPTPPTATPAREMRDSPPSAPAADGATAGKTETVPAPAPDLTGLDLAQLEQQVATCRRCGLHQGRTQTVFADGSPRTRLMFIGEGPGEDEDRQGKPFVGRAGQLLTKMIEAMGLKRDEVYIANVVKCRPPQNRTPFEDEGQTCLPYLQRQVELVHPEVIVLLGATPLFHLLGKRGITSARGNWLLYRNIPVMPSYHPAYLLRVPEKKREAWDDLQKVMARLGLNKGTPAT